LLLAEFDREEVIVAVPEDRTLRNFRREVIADYSTREKECENELFPLKLIFEPGEQLNWQMQYLQVDPSLFAERMARWKALVQDFILPIRNYSGVLERLVGPDNGAGSEPMPQKWRGLPKGTDGPIAALDAVGGEEKTTGR
jgi:hypothetical protein